MRLILFGGAEVALGQVKPELKLIEKVIKRLKPKQVLHIPFARTRAKEKEWREGWFAKNVYIGNIKYLNAKRKQDIRKTSDPLIFISGGGEKINLMRKIRSNPNLLHLIKNASRIVGESAGSEILGAYFRSKGADPRSPMMKGLDIIKNAVIEPHYTERKRQKLLLKDMQQARVQYGIGIDCMTAIEFEVNAFPKKYKKIGTGAVVVRKSPALC